MGFDAEKEVKRLVEHTRNWFDLLGPNWKPKAVLGVSGGKDSTVTAAILARALGKERVIGVLMPCGEQKDIDDSRRVISALGIQSVDFNIGKSFEAMCEALGKGVATQDAKVNLQPRLRMCALYMVAQSCKEGGIVINTCNLSEDYVGYATKFGDCAGDVSILGNYLVSEVVAMGDAMPEIPNDLVHKAPSDGLWGMTDEDKMGFTYAELEQYMKYRDTGSERINEAISRMHAGSRHKYHNMPVLGCTFQGRGWWPDSVTID